MVEREVWLQPFAEKVTKLDLWEWLPGMQYWYGGMTYRISFILPCGTYVAYDEEGIRQYGVEISGYPDLDDPATKGCMLGLLFKHGFDVHIDKFWEPDKLVSTLTWADALNSVKCNNRHV